MAPLKISKNRNKRRDIIWNSYLGLLDQLEKRRGLLTVGWILTAWAVMEAMPNDD